MIDTIKNIRQKIRKQHIKTYYNKKIIETRHGAFRVEIHRNLDGLYEIEAVGITDYVTQMRPEIATDLFHYNEKLTSVLKKVDRKLNSYSDLHCRKQKRAALKQERMDTPRIKYSFIKLLFTKSGS